MITRVKQILENFGEIVDINYIKEITKDKDKTKINLCLIKIMGFNEFYIGKYSKFYVYKNIYIKFYSDKIFLFDKDSKYIVIYYSKCNKFFHFKYVRQKNIFIEKVYYKTALQAIRITNKYIKCSYQYNDKIKNDKYKANYKLIYI